MTEGDSPPIARVVVSNTGAVRGYYPWPVLKAPAAPAGHRRKPPPRQPRAPQHPRRHRPAPKRHRPAHAKHPSQHTARPLARPKPQIPALMLLDHAVLDMQAAGASPSLLNFVNQPQNLVSTARASAKPLKDATRIQVFNSYVTIAHAIANHHIAADTRAVVYDNELSTGTPAAEVADPVRYCRLTARLLHRHGLEYVASPGFDLSGPRPSNGEWFQQFVGAGLMECGRYADYLDIQDQLMQGSAIYSHDAHDAATLLHHINPRARLLMGLSTSPSGHLATSGGLWRAYEDTKRFVNGYWLNVPHNVSGTSRPAVALQFLQKMITQDR